jgi:CBS domain containing-hemolysin-like protein
MTAKIIVMVICLLLSAYFSATETAFSSINKTRLKTIAEKGNKRATLTLKLSDSYDKLISTILIGNNIVNIAIASVGTMLFIEICGGDIGATVSTAVVTVAVLIFGEITPKSIAKDSPEKFAMFASPSIRMLIWLLTPLCAIFSLWKKLVSKIFKSEDDDKMSQEELLMIVEEAEQEGGIDTDEGDLLRNAIEFTEIRAEDILTHRVDLEAVSNDAPKEEIAQRFSDTRFSRLLVYEENIDNIVGVIHLKDFYKDNGILKDDISTIMSPPLFIHKFEKIDDLLKQLQQAKSHIAVVVDEYGGTLGIVTMEDILEELVGDIWDEHDEVIERFNEISENTYLVDCTTNFEEFCDFFELESDSESISLGGFIMEHLGRIPETNDKFSFEHLDFIIEETDSRRVISTKVIRHEKKTVDDEE